MRPGCVGFRNELEAARARGEAELQARHAHLDACAPCRVLYGEERGLDRLLAESGDVAVPPQLSLRILAAVSEARHPTTGLDVPGAEDGDGALEQLLASVPEPAVPDDLAEEVLRALSPLRARERAPIRRRRWLVAAAATLLVGVVLWQWKRSGTDGLGPDTGVGAPLVTRPGGSDEPAGLEPAGLEPTDETVETDDDLLAYVVERWDLLGDEDLDLWLASLDPRDEVLVEALVHEAYGELFDSTGAGAARGH